jgi:ABC-type branched-subunit amino acid transport system substrate-binding protein
MIGTYAPCAEFIRLARLSGFNPVFVNVSFVGANALAHELGGDGEGVIVSQVVPFPWDTSVKVVADYQAAEKAIDPDLPPDFVSLEGYICGRLAAAALEMAGPNPTRAEMLRVVNEIGQFDISGDRLSVGHKMRDASAHVYLTLIKADGTFKAIDRM